MTLMAMNAWLYLRLEPLLQDTAIGELVVLERKAAAFPAERVQVLVVGNSHAVTGLRPPQLAAAWGLPDDAVFSLALLNASPLEMRLLLARERDRFPNVRLVLSNVDSFYLGSQVWQRLRYLTAGRPVDRMAALARETPRTQLLGLVGVFAPALDFGPPLHDAFRRHPLLTARALLGPVPLLDPVRVQQLAHPYRWGVPPTWDMRRPREQRYYRLRMHEDRLQRARAMVRPPAQVAAGLAELMALADTVPRLALVETPYPPAFQADLEHLEPGFRTRWIAQLMTALAGRDIPLLPAPAALPTDFYDQDHLVPAGAERLAAFVARRLRVDGPR